MKSKKRAGRGEGGWWLKILNGLAVSGLLLILVQAGEMAWHGIRTFDLAQRMLPSSFVNEAAALRVLIVGDSTGVGVGADSPFETVGGLLARAGLEVVNKARAGDVTAEVAGQIEAVSQSRFDLTLIFTGANDVFHFIDPEEAKRALALAVERAQAVSEAVVIVPPGNVGEAPAWRDSVGVFYANHARRIRDGFRQLAIEKGVWYADLFTERLEGSLAGRPDDYFAVDQLHPNSAGYREWYRRLVEFLSERGIKLPILTI